MSKKSHITKAKLATACAVFTRAYFGGDRSLEDAMRKALEAVMRPESK